MRVPSARKFVELVALVVLSLCVTIGVTVAVILLATIVAIEAIVDRARALRRRA